MKYGHLTLFLLLLVACKKSTVQTNPQPEPSSEEQQRDSTLWGHLGEDTGMSTLQLITDEGDTLEIFRTSQYSGEDGKLLGQVRNYTDRFAITLSEGNETLLTAVNVSQLTRTWSNEDGSINIKTDGSATSEGMPYNGWKMWNGHILLSAEVKQEIGKVTRVDTMDIIFLDDDSLVIENPAKQTIRLYGR